MGSASAAPHAVVELIPLDKIAESPTNPRKTFNGIDELAESVKLHGILQPVLVRPVKGIGSNLFQLVFGARRFRAAKAADLKAIPAMVRDLSDVDALETQIVENAKREDVHPLEEAEGFEALLQSKERKYDVASIAAKVQKSESYVYQSTKLLALCKEARELFYAGRFTKTSALYVARVEDHGLQRAILKDLKKRTQAGAAFSAHEVSWTVRRHLCRLADAPFPKDDAELVAGAGPCTTCPKRSGAQPQLFGDVDKQDGDLCTDPACYQAKKDAAWARNVADAKAKGLKVLDGKAAEKAMEYGSEYVRLDRYCDRDPKQRTWKQLIGKTAKDQVVLARDEHGEVHELIPKKETAKLLKAAGHNFKTERSSSGPSRLRTDRAKETAARELRDSVGAAIAGAFIEKLKTKKPDGVSWRLAALEMGEYGGDDVFARRLGDGHKPKERVQHIAQLDEQQLQALALELCLEGLLYREGYNSERKRFRAELLKWAGIDPEKVEAEVKASRAAGAATAKQVAAAVEHLGIETEKAPKKKPAKKGKGARS